MWSTRGWFWGRCLQRNPLIKGVGLQHRSLPPTKQKRNQLKFWVIQRRRNAACYAWGSANKLVQQWCLRDLGPKVDTTQVTKEEILGRKQSNLWWTRIITSIRSFVPRGKTLRTFVGSLRRPRRPRCGMMRLAKRTERSDRTHASEPRLSSG